MISIGSIPGAGGKYYSGGKYYDTGKPGSEWGGGAKDILGLPDGPVSGKYLDMYFEGLSHDGKRLFPSQYGKKDRNPGLDMTFNAMKSLSLLTIGRSGDKYKDINMNAARKTMAFAEKNFGQTRISNPKTGKQDYVGSQKMLYAFIREMTSRALDPHDHIHVPIINLAIDKDDRIRSLHNRPLFNAKLLNGLVHRAYIARDLKTIGHDLRSSGKYNLFEVKGVPQDLLDLFSKRRAQMLELTGGKSKSAEEMSRIALISRPSKEVMEDKALIEMWKAEAKEHGYDLDQIAELSLVQAENTIPITKEAALSSAIADISENSSHFNLMEIMFTGLLRDGQGVTADELLIAVEDRVNSGKLIEHRAMGLYSTSEQIAREKAIINECKKGALKGGILPHAQLDKLEHRFEGLTPGQKCAVKLALSSPDRTSGVQGIAGSGKTYMLETMLPIARAAGITTIGIAPTTGAVKELEDTGQFDKTMTMQQFLLTPEGNSSTMLVLDEASMVCTKDMLQLIRFANSKNMPRFLPIGDREQLDAVGAGRPFANLQDTGMRTAHMTDIIRQKSERHRKGVGELAIGKVKEAFKTLEHEFHEIEKGKLHSHAKALWLEKNDPKMPVIVQTNKQKSEMNAAIKLALHEKGNISTPGILHKIWRAVHMSDEAKRDVRSYNAATHIRFNRDYKRLGVNRGDIFRIESIDTKTASIILNKDNKSITFKPAKYKFGKDGIETYRQDEINLHKDDRIRFTRGGKGRSVNNNDMGTITSITPKAISFELDKGKTISLSLSNPAIRHLDHGWANTAHAFQGKTVDDVILVMPSQKNPLLTLKSLYTGASRHRYGLAMVTDNVSRLRSNIEQQLDMELKQMKVIRPETKIMEPEKGLQIEPIIQPERHRTDRSR